MGAYRIWTIALGLLATVLFILSIAVFYGYIPASLVNNFTATELAVFGFLAGAGAVALEVADRR